MNPLYATIYFAIFGIVIAIMKDVPDVTGDEKYGIRNFSVLLGENKMFKFASNLLIVLLFGTSISLLYNSFVATNNIVHNGQLFSGIVGISMSLFEYYSQIKMLTIGNGSNNNTCKKETLFYSHYMNVWKLFFLSYVLLPITK